MGLGPFWIGKIPDEPNFTGFFENTIGKKRLKPHYATTPLLYCCVINVFY